MNTQARLMSIAHTMNPTTNPTMFDNIRTKIRSIAPTTTTALDYTIEFARHAAHFTKRGIKGYIHLVTDSFTNATNQYQRAIESDSTKMSLAHGAFGFVESFTAGLYAAAIADIPAVAYKTSKTAAATGTVSRSVARMAVGKVLFFLVFGNVYETLRTVDEDDTATEATEPTTNDDGIINADAHEHPENGDEAVAAD